MQKKGGKVAGNEVHEGAREERGMVSVKRGRRGGAAEEGRRKREERLQGKRCLKLCEKRGKWCAGRKGDEEGVPKKVAGIGGKSAGKELKCARKRGWCLRGDEEKN